MGAVTSCDWCGLRGGVAAEFRLNGSHVALRAWPRPFCDDRDRPRALFTPNGRGRPIVLQDGAGSDRALLFILFPQLEGLEILKVEDLGADGVRVTARTRTPSADCRLCGQSSSSGHDRYPRWVLDLPCGARTVEVMVSVRRFRC